MKKINFCKFEGFGNDYAVIESEQLNDIESISEFAARFCQRNRGVGADGIAVLEKLVNKPADYSCRIINPDGGEAGFSGNGTRCAVAYLYFKNLWQEKSLKLQTKSGIKTYELLEKNDFTYWFRAELGKPKFELPDSPLLNAISDEDDIAIEASSFSILLPQEGLIINSFFVDVGNPVVCIFVEDFTGFVTNSEKFEWQSIGQRIESTEELFPERTNVVFVKVIDRENVEIRIWERGAGETSSSGTCSIAAAVASAFLGKTGRKVFVRAPGGTTETVWRADGEMLITGRADFVFCGEWLESEKNTK